MGLECTPGESQAAHEGGGAPLGAPPYLMAPPGGPPVTIFCYMDSFDGKIIISHLLGRNSAATRRNLGGTNLGFWRGCSTGETSLPEGEICWKYALEAIIKVLLYFNVHDKYLLFML